MHVNIFKSEKMQFLVLMAKVMGQLRFHHRRIRAWGGEREVTLVGFVPEWYGRRRWAEESEAGRGGKKVGEGERIPN
jgi:hypothetical protein